MEVAGEDREKAVQSPSGSRSIAQEDQPLQQQASAEGASEAAQTANSDSTITSDSEEPVREENAAAASNWCHNLPYSAGFACKEVYSSGWAN